MIIGAGTLLATHFGLWFESLQLTSVASSTIITAMQPVIAMIGGFIFLPSADDAYGCDCNVDLNQRYRFRCLGRLRSR